MRNILYKMKKLGYLKVFISVKLRSWAKLRLVEI